MLSLRLFSPSISLLSVHCFMLCRALRGGKEGIVLKNIRVFWLKDTKLICFTEPGSILFDNCTSLNKHSTHGQIHHVDHQTLAICSPDWGISFAIRGCEFGKTHGKHWWVFNFGGFFTGLHKVGGMRWLQLPLSWEEFWSTALTTVGVLGTTKTSAAHWTTPKLGFLVY